LTDFYTTYITRPHLVKEFSTFYETQTFTKPIIIKQQQHNNHNNNKNKNNHNLLETRASREANILWSVQDVPYLSWEEKKSNIGFLSHFMYICSLIMRFYFHNSRHENNEIIEDTAFKK